MVIWSAAADLAPTTEGDSVDVAVSALPSELSCFCCNDCAKLFHLFSPLSPVAQYLQMLLEMTYLDVSLVCRWVVVGSSARGVSGIGALGEGGCVSLVRVV